MTVSPSPTPSAIVLAAGYSSRMGAFKPLLELNGVPAIKRIIGAYRRVGVTDIHVVTGFRSRDIETQIGDLGVFPVYNPDHDSGMFSSVKTGAMALADQVPAFFVHPVDIPLVRSHTLSLLLEAWQAFSPAVIYPTFSGHRGHPPLIHGDLRTAVLKHDGQNGLRGLLERFESEARDLPVADQGVLLDMDTPDDYTRLSEKANAPDVLTDDECGQLAEKICKLPIEIVEHCRKVAGVAERLTTALNAAGCDLDARRIRSAALLHDISRLEKNHATEGARLLEKMGFPALAEIIAVHMRIELNDRPPMDEAQVVFFADKLVAGQVLVDIDTRFSAKLKKYGKDPAVAANIQRRRQAALTIQSRIEALTGKTVGTLVAPDVVRDQ